MAWTKAKKALLATAVVLAAGTIAVVINDLASRPTASQRQVLQDGSVLTLTRVLVDSRIRIPHGTPVEKLLGNTIPSNGVHLLSLNLKRPIEMNFDSGGKSHLVAEFRLAGSNAASNPLGKSAFYRQFRFVLYGEGGIEFVQELWAGQFQSFPDGYYGYVVASRFPRDAHWLGFRVERRQTNALGGPWKKVADFKIRNPVRAVIQPWVAESAPTVKSSSGMEFALGEVTVKTIPYMTNDIWNHIVTAPLEARSDRVPLNNWSAAYVHVEDASGNWDLFASHRSLDPRYVWKLEADFEPFTNFADGNLATIRLPSRSSTLTTNVMNVPVTISWDGTWVDASMPTNDPNHVLRYVGAADDAGHEGFDAAGSWSQYFFRKGDFMTRKGGVLTTDFKPTTVTFAVVTNVHVTFYTQPKLVKQTGLEK